MDPVRNNVPSSEPGELRKTSPVPAPLCECTRVRGCVPTGVCACLCTYTYTCSGPVACWGGSRMGTMGALGHWEARTARLGTTRFRPPALSASPSLSALFPGFLTPGSFSARRSSDLRRSAEDSGMCPAVPRVERAPSALARKQQWPKQTLLTSSTWILPEQGDLFDANTLSSLPSARLRDMR